LSDAGADFAFESTLSSRTFAPFLRRLKALGYGDLYAPLADEWALFDNSTSPQALPVATQFVAQLTVMEPTIWQKLKKLRKAA
jgi:predicted ABC-type ATPase